MYQEISNCLGLIPFNFKLEMITSVSQECDYDIRISEIGYYFQLEIINS